MRRPRWIELTDSFRRSWVTTEGHEVLARVDLLDGVWSATVWTRREDGEFKSRSKGGIATSYTAKEWARSQAVRNFLALNGAAS